MAGLGCLQFKEWVDVEKYCKNKSLMIQEVDMFSFIAKVVDSNNICLGYISKKLEDYIPVEPETKYILVWD